MGAVVFALDVEGVPGLFSLGAVFLLGFALTGTRVVEMAREFEVRSFAILSALVGAVALVSSVAGPLLSGLVGPVGAGAQPYSGFFVGVVSNVVSNVPATQLILGTAPVTAALAPKIAVEAGLAGNIGPIGSFANVLALVMVRKGGLPIRKIVLLQLGVGVLGYIPAIF